MTADKLLKHNPIVVVDVGASGGLHPRWGEFTSCYRAVLFEPDERAYDLLSSDSAENLVVLNSALSDIKEKRDLYLCRKQNVSSVYYPNLTFLERFPNPQRFEVIEAVRIGADTLDNQLRLNGIPEIDFIKIDVQGHELPVLQGAANSLERCVGLELEVEFAPLYVDQPLFSDVDAFVRKCGFELFDLRRSYWKRRGSKSDGYTTGKGQLVFGDALYLKSPESLNVDEITPAKILRAVCVYLVYGYPELGQILLDLARTRNRISEEDENNIGSVLLEYKDKRQRSLIPSFRGKRRFMKALSSLANKFASQTRRDTLGNT